MFRRTGRAWVAVPMLIAAVVAFGCSSSKSSSSSATTGAASGGSAAPTTAAGPKGSVINVGVIASLTGAQASSSDQAATVAPAWEAWINANGGINGHPVKVYVEDDAGDPAKAQAAEQDLVSSKNVIAIIVGSDNEVAAFDADAISKGVAVISGTANSQDWYTKSGMFVTVTGVLPGLAAQMIVAKNFGHATKFADLYCSEIAACAQADPVLKGQATQLGVGFTSIAVSSTAPSYTAQCIQLQQEKVDYAQLNFTTSAAAKFVQDCQAQGYNPTWGSSEQAAGAAFSSLQNFTMYGPAYSFPSVADAPPIQTYRDAMQKYAKDSNWKEGAASFTWDGLQVLAKSLATVGANPARQDVLTGLYAFNGENLNGELANKLTYPQGKATGYNFNPCYFVVGMKGGQVTAPAGLTPQCPASS
jgi:branched-chain amino acid transport system substrate-binding protein